MGEDLPSPTPQCRHCHAFQLTLGDDMVCYSYSLPILRDRTQDWLSDSINSCTPFCLFSKHTSDQNNVFEGGQPVRFIAISSTKFTARDPA